MSRAPTASATGPGSRVDASPAVAPTIVNLLIASRIKTAICPAVVRPLAKGDFVICDGA